MSETTQQIIERVGLIPVLRAKSVAQGRAVVDAMIAGGVTVVEVTMTVPGAVDLLKELNKEYGSKLLLGSVTSSTGSEDEQAPTTVDSDAPASAENGRSSEIGMSFPVRCSCAVRSTS